MPTISYNCDDGYYEACDGTAPKQEWNEHDSPCTCRCHVPPPEETFKQQHDE
jgi:hypothetical protein